MNVVEEMTELALARPVTGDPPERLAGWYLAKSRLHEYLAGCGDTDAEFQAGLALAARAHAAAILASAAAGMPVTADTVLPRDYADRP